RGQLGDGPATQARGAGWLSDVRHPTRQGAVADDLRRRCHDRTAARGVGRLQVYAVLSTGAALDREDAAAGRRFRVAAVRCTARRGARTLALPQRGSGPTSG